MSRPIYRFAPVLRAPAPARSRFVQLLGASVLLSFLAGCGGGGGDEVPASGSSATTGVDAASTVTTLTGSETAQSAAAPGATRLDAWRLLTQATFGPTDADIAKVMSTGSAAWVDAQLATGSSSSMTARWDAMNKLAVAANPSGNAGATPVSSQFFQQAVANPDQLRQRVAFALSEIFVVSTQSLKGDRARAVAAYYDMLNRDAFGSYRTLLQDVAMHPAMGQFLSSIKNVKENPATGQVPDQNFAREVMQLMSIGLSQLNADGTKKLDANGAPVDTYATDDIVGLSKVFTGFSWYGPDLSSKRFNGSPSAQDPNRWSQPMQAYAEFHSTSEKAFLGTRIAAQGTPAPTTDLATALDAIARHPNVGPFLGRQLIQRLVTSNPSPAYVARVAAVFNDNGKGARGDLKAVVRAILLDPEARTPAGDAYGKLREPVLRLTAWMRAFGAKSDSGAAIITNTDDPGLELGQTPLRADSVFNFFRPGYIAAGSETGARNLTMPELQATSETSVAGYVNYMSTAIVRGVGSRGLNGTAARPDVQPDYAGELAVAGTTGALVDRVTAKLLGDGIPDTYKSQLRAAVDSIAIPAAKANGANAAQIDTAKKNRVYAAVLLTLASPEFIVQK